MGFQFGQMALVWYFVKHFCKVQIENVDIGTAVNVVSDFVELLQKIGNGGPVFEESML